MVEVKYLNILINNFMRIDGQLFCFNFFSAKYFELFFISAIMKSIEQNPPDPEAPEEEAQGPEPAPAPESKAQEPEATESSADAKEEDSPPAEEEEQEQAAPTSEV